LTNLAVIVLILLVVATIFVFRTIRNTAKQHQEDIREEMDPESRSLYAPIRRLTDEIEQLVGRHSDSAIMKVVGGEAVDEAKRIRDQVAKALAVRDDLKRAMREKNLAVRDIEDLRSQVESADDVTRPALVSALEAREMELGHYSVVQEAVAKIDSGVTQAQAALAEMKARLSVKASNEKATAATEDEDLRDTIGRMRSLSISYDEAEELLQH
jgi:hypothetical protein